MRSRSATSACSWRPPRFDRGLHRPRPDRGRLPVHPVCGDGRGGRPVSGGRRHHARRERPPPHLVPSLSRSMTLILRNRRVAFIALIVVTCEVLGFSSLTVFPTFARDVLGLMRPDSEHSPRRGRSARSRACSSSPGSASRVPRSCLVLLGTSTLGLGLVAFALSTSFALSFAFLVLVGAAMASSDTWASHSFNETWTTPNVVRDGDLVLRHRVRSARSCRPGSAANAIGAPAALAISGTILTLFAAELSRVRAIHELCDVSRLGSLRRTSCTRRRPPRGPGRPRSTGLPRRLERPLALRCSGWLRISLVACSNGVTASPSPRPATAAPTATSAAIPDRFCAVPDPFGAGLCPCRRDRPATVHVPADYDPGKPAPLLVLLHGFAAPVGTSRMNSTSGLRPRSVVSGTSHRMAPPMPRGTSSGSDRRVL